MGTPVRWGHEFLVNTTTASHQCEPAVTGLADGRFVVAWTDASQTDGDTSSWAVRAQVFNADGTASGAEFLVNTTSANAQYAPTIAALSGGGFVVVWTDESRSIGDRSGSAIRAQVFNADGSTLGAEFRVNTSIFQAQLAPAITALTDGRFVVTWVDYSSADGAIVPDLKGQVFEADGSASGSEFLVNTNTTGFQREPTITARAGGTFVVAWEDYNPPGDGSLSGISARVFNSDGSTSGAAFLVNTSTDDYQI